MVKSKLHEYLFFFLATHAQYYTIHETSLEAREDFTSFPPAPVVLTGVSIICDVHDYVPFLLAPDLYPKE